MMVPPGFLVGFLVDISNINVELSVPKDKIWLKMLTPDTDYINRDLNVPNYDDQLFLTGKEDIHLFLLITYSFIQKS